MKKLAMLLFVLAMCVPSYGTVLGSSVLVYKVTTAINPVIEYNDVDADEAGVWRQNLSAYVVFEMNDAYAVQIHDHNEFDVNDINDVNNPTVILFFKEGIDNFQMTLGGTDEPNSSVLIYTYGDEYGSTKLNSVKPFEITNNGNIIATAVGITFWDSNTTADFRVQNFLYGKNTSIDIGKAARLSLAKSLKGQVLFESEEWFFQGWGTTTAMLDLKLTKDANMSRHTVAATVANIKTTVLSKYKTVTELP